ncbi:MAG: hypothetical protein RSD95_14385 [Clostridia bacterium]
MAIFNGGMGGGGGPKIHGAPVKIQVDEGQSIKPGDFVSFTTIGPTSPATYTLPDGVALSGSGYNKTVLFDTNLALTIYAKSPFSYVLHARVCRLMPDGSTVPVTPETAVKTVESTYRLSVPALIQKSENSSVFLCGWTGYNGDNGRKMSGIMTLSYSAGSLSVGYAYDFTGDNPRLEMMEKVADNKYVAMVCNNSPHSFSNCAAYILTDTGSAFTLGSGTSIGATGGIMVNIYSFMVTKKYGVFIYNSSLSSWLKFEPFTINDSVTMVVPSSNIADGTTILSSTPLSHLVLSNNTAVIYAESSLLVITTLGDKLSLGIKTALGSFWDSDVALIPVETIGECFIAVYRKASTDADVNAAICEVNSSVITIKTPIIIGTAPQLENIEPVWRVNRPTDKFTYSAKPSDNVMYFIRSVEPSFSASAARKGTLPHGVSKGSGEAGQMITVIVPGVS